MFGGQFLKDILDVMATTGLAGPSNHGAPSTALVVVLANMPNIEVAYLIVGLVAPGLAGSVRAGLAAGATPWARDARRLSAARAHAG